MTAVGAQMSAPLEPALIRIGRGADPAVGMAFLIAADLALTCAHVVCGALGLPYDTAERPADPVRVDFPMVAPDEPAEAHVERWLPRDSGDLAVLRVSAPPPGARPLRLIRAPATWGHEVGVFGVPATHPDGVYASGILRGRQGTGWVQLDRHPTAGRAVGPGFSGAPVWDAASHGFAGLVVAADDEPDARIAYMIPTTEVVGHWPDLLDADRADAPYLGLRSFTEADAELFHGRAALSARLAATVARRAATLVVGPSGCGKSSLLNAGVVPLMRADGRAIAHLAASMAIGAWESLAGALIPLLEPDVSEVERLRRVRELGDLLARDGPGTVLARIRARTGMGLVVLIDQFESVLPDDPGAEPDAYARAYASVVAGLVASEGVHVVVVLRSDFLDRAMRLPALTDHLGDAVFAVPPMGRDELRGAIADPLAGTGIGIEPGLTDRIIGDLGAADRLAPLEFTLAELWRTERGDLLSHRTYADLGGVDGALTRYADRVYDALSPADRNRARELFLQLVRPTTGDDPPVRRVAVAADMAARVWRLAQDTLVPARLVVADRAADGTETVTLAHEALAAHWRRLRRWLADDRRFRVRQEDLRERMARWQRSGRRDGDLLPTGYLAPDDILIDRAADLPAPERAYIGASRALWRRKARAKRGALTAGVVVALVIVALGTLFGNQRYETARQRRAGAARTLAAQAQQAMVDDDIDTAMWLSLAAYRTAPRSVEARHALFLAYRATRSVERGQFPRLQHNPVPDAAGKVAAAISDDRRNLFVWKFGEPRARTVALGDIGEPQAGVTPDLAVSADGRKAAVVGTGVVEVIDLATPRLLWRARIGTDRAGSSPVFTPDGRWLFVIDYAIDQPRHAIARRWSAGTGAAPRTSTPPRTVRRLLKSAADLPAAHWQPLPDGDSLYVPPNLTGTGAVWNTATGRVSRSRDEDVTVSPDGQRSATCRPVGAGHNSSVLTLRRRPDGRGGDAARVPFQSCASMYLANGGRYMTVSNSDDKVGVFDFATHRIVAASSAVSNTADPLGLSVLGNGAFRFLAGESGNLMSHILRVGRLSSSPDTEENTAIAADSAYAVTTGINGAHLSLWNGRDGRFLKRAARPPRDHGTGQWDILRFSPNNAFVVALSAVSGHGGIWEVPSLRLRARFSVPRPEAAGPNALDAWFDATGTLVVNSDGRISRWNPWSGRHAGTDFDLARAARQDPPVAVAPLPGGDRVATAAPGTPRIDVWDLRRQRRTETIPHAPENIDRLAVSPDGTRVAASGESGAIRVFIRRGGHWADHLITSRGSSNGATTGSALAFLPHARGAYRLVALDGPRFWTLRDDGTATLDLDLTPSADSPNEAIVDDPAQISDDGTMITGGGIEDAALIPASPVNWRDHVCGVLGHPHTVPADLRADLPDAANVTPPCP